MSIPHSLALSSRSPSLIARVFSTSSPSAHFPFVASDPHSVESATDYVVVTPLDDLAGKEWLFEKGRGRGEGESKDGEVGVWKGKKRKRSASLDAETEVSASVDASKTKGKGKGKEKEPTIPSTRLHLPPLPADPTTATAGTSGEGTGTEEKSRWKIVHLAFFSSSLLVLSQSLPSIHSSTAPSSSSHVLPSPPLPTIIRATTWNTASIPFKTAHDVLLPLSSPAELLSVRILQERGPELVAIFSNGQIALIALPPPNLLPKQDPQLLTAQIPLIEGSAEEWRLTCSAVSSVDGQKPIKFLIAHHAVHRPHSPSIPFPSLPLPQPTNADAGIGEGEAKSTPLPISMAMAVDGPLPLLPPPTTTSPDGRGDAHLASLAVIGAEGEGGGEADMGMNVNGMFGDAETTNALLNSITSSLNHQQQQQVEGQGVGHEDDAELGMGMGIGAGIGIGADDDYSFMFDSSLENTTMDDLDKGFGGSVSSNLNLNLGVGVGGDGDDVNLLSGLDSLTSTAAAGLGVGGGTGFGAGDVKRLLGDREKEEERTEILLCFVLEGTLRIQSVKRLLDASKVVAMEWVGSDELLVLENGSGSGSGAGEGEEGEMKVWKVERSLKTLSKSFKSLFPEKKKDWNLPLEWTVMCTKENTIVGISPRRMEVREGKACVLGLDTSVGGTDGGRGTEKLCTVDLETLQLVGEKSLEVDGGFKDMIFSPDFTLAFLDTTTTIQAHTLFDLSLPSVPTDPNIQYRVIGESLANSILSGRTATPLLILLSKFSTEAVTAVIKYMYAKAQLRLGQRILERSPLVMHLLGVQAELFKHKAPLRSKLCLDLLSLCFTDLAITKYYMIPLRGGGIEQQKKDKKTEPAKPIQLFHPDCIWPIVGHQVWFMELMRRVFSHTLLGTGADQKEKVKYAQYDKPGDHFLLFHPLPRALIMQLITHFASFDAFLTNRPNSPANTDGGDYAKHVLADHAHAIGLHLPSILDQLKNHLGPRIDEAWKTVFGEKTVQAQSEALQTLVIPPAVSKIALKEALVKLANTFIMWESPFYAASQAEKNKAGEKNKVKIDCFTKSKILSSDAPLSMCRRCRGFVEENFASRWMGLEWSKRCFCGGDRWMIANKTQNA
ncbi:hypothetical protein BT69DRAFT_1283323 [Atractiella rhizophila]|nr:hypothetical protein BT69DRAFT_1283323 [Atractiella rhizophila]